MKLKKTLSTCLFAGICIFIICLVNTNAFAAAIWTTRSACGGVEQDANEYVAGEHVYINASGLTPNASLHWTITGQPASCDGNEVIAQGDYLTDGNGDACFDAYTIGGDGDADCGVYKVNYGGKNDNYHVTGEEPLPDTGAISITKVVTGACSGTSFEISITGPSPSTDTSSLTIQCDNGGTPIVFDGLAPGTYTIDEDPGSGWHHETSLPDSVTVTANQTTNFTITNAPDPTPPPTTIPTLSEWGMIIFSLLLAGSAIWMIRRRGMA